VILLSGCKESNEVVDISSPMMTASTMNFLASSDILYEDFKKLFVANRDEDFIHSKYELVKKSETGALISTLSLVRNLDGKTLLIQLWHDIESDQYLIYDVIEVPDDVAAFFEENLD
jgi:hypothetical protein